MHEFYVSGEDIVRATVTLVHDDVYYICYLYLPPPTWRQIQVAYGKHRRTPELSPFHTNWQRLAMF